MSGAKRSAAGGDGNATREIRLWGGAAGDSGGVGWRRNCIVSRRRSAGIRRLLGVYYFELERLIVLESGVIFAPLSRDFSSPITKKEREVEGG